MMVASGRSLSFKASTGVSRKQPAAALGDHDGVEHHEAGLAAHERVGHRLDLLDRAEHADLDRVDANVVKERVDLLLEEGRGHGHDAVTVCVF